MALSFPLWPYLFLQPKTFGASFQYKKKKLLCVCRPGTLNVCGFFTLEMMFTDVHGCSPLLYKPGKDVDSIIQDIHSQRERDEMQEVDQYVFVYNIEERTDTGRSIVYF